MFDLKTTVDNPGTSVSPLPKRESSPVMNRPQERAQERGVIVGDIRLIAINRPVEPSRAIVPIPFSQITPEIIDAAPIAHYLRTQFDNKYSRQCLIRRLIEMIDQEPWHALCGVLQFRQIHHANVVLIEQLLALLDEREEQVAA